MNGSRARNESLVRAALWVLALFVFSLPVQNVVSIPGVGSVSRMIGVLAFLTGVASMVSQGRMTFRAPSAFIVLAVLSTLWGASTYFWSIAPGTTLSSAVTFTQLTVMAWLVHQLVRTEQDLDFLWQAFVLGCLLMIGIGIAAFFGSGGGTFRYVGGFNANGFAITSALAIPMAWGLAVRRSHPRFQLLNVTYPWMALTALVLSASRGGLFTAMVALLIMPLLMREVRWLGRIGLFIALIVPVWASFELIPEVLPTLDANIERLADADEQLRSGTFTGRTTIWAAGLEVYREAPIVGVGMGGFNSAVLPILGEARSAHNAFLAVAVGAGAIGVWLFVALVTVPLVGLLTSKLRRLEHLVLFAALLVSMMPTNSEDDKHVWFILATLSAARPVVIVSGNGRTSRSNAATEPVSRKVVHVRRMDG